MIDENISGQNVQFTPHNLPDIIVTQDKIIPKFPNSPEIHINPPAIVINDVDKQQPMIPFTVTRPTSPTLFFGATNLDDKETNPGFQEEVFKSLLDNESASAQVNVIQKKQPANDLASQVNKGEFNPLHSIKPDDLKNMPGYNPEELDKIQKELNESIKKGLVTYYQEHLKEETTEVGPSPSDLRSAKSPNFDT